MEMVEGEGATGPFELRGEGGMKWPTQCRWQRGNKQGNEGQRGSQTTEADERK